MGKEVCKECYECQGHCWINVGGVFDVWEICSRKCKGTKVEQECLDKLFSGEVEEKELLNKLNLDDEELKIIKEFYFMK